MTGCACEYFGLLIIFGKVFCFVEKWEKESGLRSVRMIMNLLSAFSRSRSLEGRMDISLCTSCTSQITVQCHMQDVVVDALRFLSLPLRDANGVSPPAVYS